MDKSNDKFSLKFDFRSSQRLEYGRSRRMRHHYPNWLKLHKCCYFSECKMLI